MAQTFAQVQALLESSRLDSMPSEERAQRLEPADGMHPSAGGYGLSRVSSMGAASSSEEEEYE